MEQFRNVEVKVRLADLVPVDRALENNYKKHWRNDIESLGQQDYFYDACNEKVQANLRAFRVTDIDDVIREAGGTREGLRIKLREQWNVHDCDGHGGFERSHTIHLITYVRPDAGVRTSIARKRAVQRNDLGELIDTLGRPTCVIVKHRRVAWIEGTRVHLDDVQNIGRFVELEAILATDETEDSGRERVESILEGLGIQDCERVHGSYVDMQQKSE